jgi:hypothetical protein
MVSRIKTTTEKAMISDNGHSGKFCESDTD